MAISFLFCFVFSSFFCWGGRVSLFVFVPPSCLVALQPCTVYHYRSARASFFDCVFFVVSIVGAFKKLVAPATRY